MPKRFTATENAVEKGLENTTPASGVKLVEAWETELEDADFSGAKGIAADLERLRKELERDEPKSDAIAKLIGKLGEATAKAADKADDKTADKVRALGEALTKAA